MAKTPKAKNPEAVGFKEIFGCTALSTNNGLAAIFMSTMFMTFMTDYAGLGKLGATLATVLLLAFFIGIDFVPGSNLSMEIMDYTIYKTGKDRSALTGVLEKFLEKAQSAVSSAIVGGVLIAIGYQVDSVTGNYIGDLAKMPTMLTWMIVIIGLVPAILAVIGILIIRKYPITPEVRRDIQSYIAAHLCFSHAPLRTSLEEFCRRGRPSVFFENDRILYGAVPIGAFSLALGPAAVWPVSEGFCLAYASGHGMDGPLQLPKKDMGAVARLLKLVHLHFTGAALGHEDIPVTSGVLETWQSTRALCSQQAQNDQQFAERIGAHHEEMRFLTGVSLEADKEQRRVGDEKQRSAHGGDKPCRGAEADAAQERKAVHDGIEQQIQHHRGVQPLRQMRPEPDGKQGDRGGAGQEDDQGRRRGDPGRIEIPPVAEDVAHMAEQKGDPPGGKPSGPLPHQQHIPEPAENQRQHDRSPRRRRCREIKAQQRQHEKGLCIVAPSGVFAHGGDKVGKGREPESGQKHGFHRRFLPGCARRPRLLFCGASRTQKAL